MDTGNIDVPNSRAIAKQLLSLAKDPANQPFIVQEQGCLTGLVQYCQHEDVDVVLIATRALQFLSSHPDNKATMRDFPDLVDNLSCALSRSSEHPRIKEFVYDTFDNLGVCIRKEEYEFDEEDAENQGDYGNMMQNPRRSSLASCSKPLNEFRTICLAVEGAIAPDTRERIESIVIKVAGVISVTVNPDRGHILIGTRETENDFVNELAYELSLAQIKAQQIVKSTGQTEENALENDYPEYLDEDDYDDEPEDGGTRLTRQGYGSLEARLEEQRREEEERKMEKSSRLLGKVNNLLSNASSWLMGY